MKSTLTLGKKIAIAPALGLLLSTSTIAISTLAPSAAWAQGNPASIHCEEKGGRLELVNQVGYCVLPNGIRCEEWAFFRGTCPAPTPSVGGFSAISVNAPQVQKAAKFAARHLGSTLKKVKTAQQQVVAGMNYDLVILLNNMKSYKVRVYMQLNGSMRLESSKKL